MPNLVPWVPRWLPKVVEKTWPDMRTVSGKRFTSDPAQTVRATWFARFLPRVTRCWTVMMARRLLVACEQDYPHGRSQLRDACRKHEQLDFGLASSDDVRSSKDALWQLNSRMDNELFWLWYPLHWGAAACCCCYESMNVWASSTNALRLYSPASERRLLRLFMEPSVPVIDEHVVGLARGWLDGWWADRDDRLIRLVLADALEEIGFVEEARLRALRELPYWHPGMWPMTPDVVKYELFH